MNFSASQHYHDERLRFRRKQLEPTEIRKRWFRHFYVLEQAKNYTIGVFVLKQGEFKPEDYDGTYYGPFYEEDAKQFRKEMIDLHDWFLFSQ